MQNIWIIKLPSHNSNLRIRELKLIIRYRFTYSAGAAISATRSVPRACIRIARYPIIIHTIFNDIFGIQSKQLLIMYAF